MSEAGKAEKQAKRKYGLIRFAQWLVLLMAAFILGGFLSFTYKVEYQKRADPVPKADGIVVWTGKGGGRLEAGKNLLQNGHGERLLISGVNEANDREDVVKLLKLNQSLADCCLDLDYAARDTIGNARETASWSEALGYEHIILVTSAYHMPRAEVEISAARGKIRITPYPVFPNDQARWWNDMGQFRRMSQEYGKLLLTYARRTSAGSERRTPLLEDIPALETPQG